MTESQEPTRVYRIETADEGGGFIRHQAPVGRQRKSRTWIVPHWDATLFETREEAEEVASTFGLTWIHEIKVTRS